MYWKDVKYNTCIINSSSHWEDMGSTETADPNTWVRNMRLENITVEGMTNCAVRIYALSSTENIHIKNLNIDSWNDLGPSSQVSHLKRYTNAAGQKVTLGNETGQSRGIKLENYTVGGEVIDKSGDNWGADKLGRLGFDAETWDNWNAWGDGTGGPGNGGPGNGGPGNGGPGNGAFVNAATGKCMDRAGGGTANGTAVQQWSCADVPAMTWAVDGRQLISGGKCLDTVGGAKVHLWDCGGWSSQEWTHQSDGSLKHLASGRCLDVERQSTADGAALHLWDCGGWSSQRWALTS